MVSDADEFKNLLHRARDGDAAAIAALAQTYERDLRIAARVHLGPALRPYLDSIDLVQSVHRSLMRGLRDQKIDVNNSASLVALALTMVRRKVARQWRRHRRQRRLDAPDAIGAAPIDVLATLTVRTANPEWGVQLQEILGLLWNELSDVDRRLLELRLDGWSTAEAAEKMGHSTGALRIRLLRLRRQLAEHRILGECL